MAVAKPKTCLGAAGLIRKVVLAVLVILIIMLLWRVFVRGRIQGFSQQAAAADLKYVYMDGCGHCEQFTPVWTAFVAKYKDALFEAGVTTHKLKNDDKAASGLGLSGYPSVLLVSTTGDFSQQTFSGDRSVQGLAGFIQDNIPSFSP